MSELTGSWSLPMATVSDLVIVVHDDAGEDVELTTFCDTYGEDREGVAACELVEIPGDPERLRLELELEQRGFETYPSYPGCSPTAARTVPSPQAPPEPLDNPTLRSLMQ